MSLRNLIFITVLWIIALLVMWVDFFFIKWLDNKYDIEAYNWSVQDIIPKKTELLSFENQKNLDISIDELLFYQEKYKNIPQLDCKKDLDLRLKRSYLLDITTFDKNKLLQ